MQFTSSSSLLAACVLLSTQMLMMQVEAVNLETEHILTPMSDLSSNRVLQTYQIGPEGKRANVIHYAANDNQHERRNINANEPIKHPNVTTIDMTPAKCTSSQCYIGAFQRPNQTDCDDVWAAQLYNSTGSLTAFPGTFVYVWSDTCAVVFQNPDKHGYSLQFNWAELGAVGQGLNNKCLPPTYNGVGGACLFEHYLKFNLTNVLVSVQRHAPEKKN